jgi:hypothetical protein
MARRKMMMTSQGLMVEAPPLPLDPRYIALTHDDPDKDGNVRYNILSDGLCIEDSVCKKWELMDRLETLVEHLYKVC